MDGTEVKPRMTPKDFFLWAGAMVTLYVSIFSLIALLFEYINYAFPDPLSYVDPFSASMRFYIASLIVLFPTFLLLMRLIRNDMTRHGEKRDLWVRRWALYLTVFVAAVAVVGDLITLINYLLGGDLTTRFILKVVVVLLVAGAGFLHFLADIRGYWLQFPERARVIGYAAGALVLLSVASGFFIMGSPLTMRAYRFDEQKVNDLSTLQSQIVYYWQSKQALPATLTELEDPISGYRVPVDVQTGEPYVYRKTGNNSFELCAVFNEPTRDSREASVPAIYKNGTQENWQHGAGEVCFARTIDPELYPPINKPAVRY